MRLSDESFRGRAIISADGQVVGEVTAIFLTREEWRLESLRVRLGKDVADHLGAGRTLFHPGVIEIPIHTVQSVGEKIVLSVPVDALRDCIKPDSSEELDSTQTSEARPHT